MMGTTDLQARMFHTVQLEDLVPPDHPVRRIRPLIDAARIRALCADLYCPDNGRPSIPPEQLFLAMLGGYLLGVRSDRKLILELTCNMAFRWFVGLDLDSPIWDASTFSKNRVHRFDETRVLETLFDDTVREAIRRGWVSAHWSVDGTLVRADASQKSFVPLEVWQTPQQYRAGLRRAAAAEPGSRDDDPGNPTVNWRGERRSNATHRSTTDPDARLATKSARETAVPAYTVMGVMENRRRVLVGIGVECGHGPAVEREGALALLTRARRRFARGPTTLGADKGFWNAAFLRGCFRRRIAPHVAVMARGSTGSHARVRMRQRGLGYLLSQRARKKIEELWGESKQGHGFRRFMRRTLTRVREETWFMGWVLNLKRLAAGPVPVLG